MILGGCDKDSIDTILPDISDVDNKPEEEEPTDQEPDNNPALIFIKVNFEYRYHMSSEYESPEDDWFADHAGSAFLYVFDEDGTYLFSEQRNKTLLDKSNPDFSILLDETKLEPGKNYIFAAMAQGNHAGYEASLATPGFVIQDGSLIPNISKIDDFRVKLDRKEGISGIGETEYTGWFNWKESYADNNLKLDTLWSTHKTNDRDFPGYVTMPERKYGSNQESTEEIVVPVTIQLMRITKSIKINLVCDQFNQDTNADDYKFIINFPKGNGTLGITGDVDYGYGQELLYYSLRKQMQPYQYKQANAQYDTESSNNVASDEMTEGDSSDTKNLGTRTASYCVNAEFGVSRLLTYDSSYLQLVNATTEKEIARIDNLSDWLVNYFDHRYDDQEFLDREYDYTIDLHIDNEDNILFIQAGCDKIGWGKRIHFLDLY